MSAVVSPNLGIVPRSELNIIPGRPNTRRPTRPIRQLSYSESNLQLAQLRHTSAFSLYVFLLSGYVCTCNKFLFKRLQAARYRDSAYLAGRMYHYPSFLGHPLRHPHRTSLLTPRYHPSARSGQGTSFRGGRLPAFRRKEPMGGL